MHYSNSFPASAMTLTSRDVKHSFEKASSCTQSKAVWKVRYFAKFHMFFYSAEFQSSEFILFTPFRNARTVFGKLLLLKPGIATGSD